MKKNCNDDLITFNFTSSAEFKFENTIPIITNNQVSYHKFFEENILSNQACVIKNVAQNWVSFLHWTEDGKPNLEYLLKKYGNCTVTKYDCNKQYYNSQEAKDCFFKEYINYWNQYILHGEQRLFYLKDWHLKKQFPEDNFYEVPLYFKSDWLNEYLCHNDKDDYRFVYMGPKGTWTPFHADVFRSYSWSVNICGLKRWILLFPGEELKLKDKFGNLPFDISEMYHDVKHYEILQGSGEAVFIPSGWYHQVWNMDDTISINHNWINGCNIKYVYKSLNVTLKEVENEISDCKDMDNFDAQCQLILKSTFGMDYQDFLDFIMYILVARTKVVETNFEDIIGRNQVLFDINCIKEVFFIIKDDVTNNDKIKSTLDKIENIFEEYSTYN